MSSSRNKFYGPFREAIEIAQKHKDTCTKDCVQEALSSGEYGGDRELTWLTSTKQQFKGEQIGKLLKPNSQLNIHRDESTLVLGFDGNTRYLTTNQDYKSHAGSLRLPARYTVREKTNIPDFCAEYAEKTGTEDSEYQSSYETYKKEHRPLPKSLEERRKHTNDLRATHFSLGDNSSRLFSETQHSFNEQPAVDATQNFRKAKALETYQSKVFRNGDWNEQNRCCIKAGLTQNDFPLHSSNLYQNHNLGVCNDEKDYHRRTHFTLGSVKRTTESAYQKDYTKSNPSLDFNRTPFADSPPSSKLFHSALDDPSLRFTTTQKKSFDERSRDLVTSLKKDRLSDLNKVKQRHAESSIMFQQHIPSDRYKRQLSVTASDFHEKPGLPKSELDYRLADSYNHLTGHFNDWVCSEAKEKYKSPNHQSTARNECELRRRDNKSTHFDFGDSIRHNKHSEHSSQYQVHLPLDPSLRPAGKSMPHFKTYSHVYPSVPSTLENYRKDTLPVSVMKDHYKHYDHTQLELPLCKDTSKRIDTHFFHLDNHYSGTKSSTTKTDFMPPATPLLATM